MHDLVLVVVVRSSYTLKELHLGRSFLRRSRLSYVRASVRRPSALLSGSPRRAGRDAAAAGRSTNRASNLWREGGSEAAAAVPRPPSVWPAGSCDGGSVLVPTNVSNSVFHPFFAQICISPGSFLLSFWEPTLSPTVPPERQNYACAKKMENRLILV